MRILLLGLLAAMGACAIDSQVDVGSDPGGGKGDVWGADDRIERYEITSTKVHEVARSSLATVVATSLQLDTARSVWSASSAQTLATDQSLCAGQRFDDQPVVADCSATLIAPDVALTAGHCFESSADCSGILLVFDYAYDARTTDHMKVAREIPDANVFRCAEMLARKFDADDDNHGHDYAVMRLDRAVPADRAPVKVNWTGPLAASTPITTIGYPAGIPLKAAPGKILDPASTEQFFTHDADVLGGTSGGGVFDRDGLLLGLHSGSSGQRYIPGPDGRCNVIAQCGVNAECPIKPAAYDVRALYKDLSPALRTRIGAP